MSSTYLLYYIFFFNDTATTEIYTLSLHDALPISANPLFQKAGLPIENHKRNHPQPVVRSRSCAQRRKGNVVKRSEEHTSELQSRPHLVCRLLLEKKKKKKKTYNKIKQILQITIRN